MPIANLYVSVLQRLGLPIERFASSTGTLRGLEAEHRLQSLRDLDLGFAWAAFRWADGQHLDRVLAGAEEAGTELSGGDFVRWARQLVDLLDQVAAVAEGPVAVAARAAVGRVRRGVVAVAVGG